MAGSLLRAHSLGAASCATGDWTFSRARSGAGVALDGLFHMLCEETAGSSRVSQFRATKRWVQAGSPFGVRRQAKRDAALNCGSGLEGSPRAALVVPSESAVAAALCRRTPKKARMRAPKCPISRFPRKRESSSHGGPPRFPLSRDGRRLRQLEGSAWLDAHPFDAERSPLNCKRKTL